MAAWTQRQIDAPGPEPFFSEAEVRQLLSTLAGASLSETSLDRLIAAGQLPRPLKRGGRNCWAWEDIVYCNLSMKLADRLEPLAPMTDAPPEEEEEWVPQNRPKIPKNRPKLPQNESSSG